MLDGLSGYFFRFERLGWKVYRLISIPELQFHQNCSRLQHWQCFFWLAEFITFITFKPFITYFSFQPKIHRITLNQVVDVIFSSSSYLSDQGTIWPDQLDLSAFQKPKYHLSKCSFDLIQTNRVESNSILMSSPLSAVQSKTFRTTLWKTSIYLREQRSFSFFIWSQPIGRGLMHDIKQKSFGTVGYKKILLPKMQTYDKESYAKRK